MSTDDIEARILGAEPASPNDHNGKVVPLQPGQSAEQAEQVVELAPGIDWSEFWKVDHAKAEWLLDDVLAYGRGHALWAKAGGMKSLFALWAALRLVDAGHVVLYLDYEMGKGDLQERLQDMGYGPDSDLSRLDYVPFPELPTLDTDAGGRDLVERIGVTQGKHPGGHITVIIDTISRAVQGPENDNDTALAFYTHTQEFASSASGSRGFASITPDGQEATHVARAPSSATWISIGRSSRPTAASS